MAKSSGTRRTARSTGSWRQSKSAIRSVSSASGPSPIAGRLQVSPRIRPTHDRPPRSRPHPAMRRPPPSAPPTSSFQLRLPADSRSRTIAPAVRPNNRTIGRRGPDQRPMAAGPLRRMVGQRRRPGLDRLVGQVPLARPPPRRWPSRSAACGPSPGPSSRSSPGRRGAGDRDAGRPRRDAR